MCQDNFKQKYTAAIISNKEISQDVYEMVFEQPQVASETKPGQFLNMYCKDKSTILPRPISICEVDKNDGWVKVIYSVVGKGTKEFASLNSGDNIEVLGPLGNGFIINQCEESIIVGGGVGTPPLLELVKNIKGKKKVYLGFRTNPYLVEEFKKYAEVHIATDDGSVGYKGTVIDLMNNTNANGQIVAKQNNWLPFNTTQLQIPISDLPDGLFLLKVHSESGTHILRFVVQKY